MQVLKAAMQVLGLAMGLIAALSLIHLVSIKENDKQADILTGLNYPSGLVEQVRRGNFNVDIYTGCVRDQDKDLDWEPLVDINGSPICLTPAKDGIKLMAQSK